MSKSIIEIEFRPDRRGLGGFYIRDTDLLHREDGPAFIEDDIDHWYQHGKRHRLDGPAIEYEYGLRYWFVNGKLATSAKEFRDLSGLSKARVSDLEDRFGKISNITEFTILPGTMVWLKDGLMHRDNNPAVIDYLGTEYWYQNGLLHRVDGPACSQLSGYQSWSLNGEFHREGGEPAITHDDGSLEWWINGKCHREDGPAFYDTEDNTYEWYINNEEVKSSKEYQILTGKTDEEMMMLILKYGNNWGHYNDDD